MPILQVKTQESIDDPLSDHTASASTSQGAPTDGQHGQASSVQHHHRRTVQPERENDSACEPAITYQESQASDRASESKAPRQYSDEAGDTLLF